MIEIQLVSSKKILYEKWGFLLHLKFLSVQNIKFESLRTKKRGQMTKSIQSIFKFSLIFNFAFFSFVSTS